jgi:hypothetical protein
MIGVSADVAIAVAGLVAVVAVGWGANLSVRSATNGPEWALEHLSGLRGLWPVLIGLGVVSMVMFSPIWLGLALSYIVATVWFLSASLLRNLHRIQNLDGFVDIGVDRRTRIVSRARRYLIAGGVFMGGLGALGVGVGFIGWIAILMGLVLVGTALLLGARDG